MKNKIIKTKQTVIKIIINGCRIWFCLGTNNTLNYLEFSKFYAKGLALPSGAAAKRKRVPDCMGYGSFRLSVRRVIVKHIPINIMTKRS